MSKLINQEGKKVSEVEFPVRVNGNWDIWTTESVFKGYKQRLKNLFKSIHSLLTKRLTLSKVKILR
jgi:hypothetical protein